MEQVANAIVLGSCYCLFAVGLSLTWGTLNVLNLAHGSVFMFSAFTCYLVTQRLDYNVPLFWLIVLAMVAGIVLELALDLLVFRPIRKRSRTLGEAELSMLIGSIGAAAILVSIAQIVTVDTPFTISANAINVAEYHIGSLYITDIEVVIVVFTLVTTVSLALWLQRTRTGRALRALSIDVETSGLMGISQGRLSALALVISGMTAGAAGVFLAIFLDSLTPEDGQDFLLKAFAAVVLGGVGSVWGTLVGAFALAAGETLVSATTSGTWTDGVSFGLIILVLLIRPSGLFSRVKAERT
jgi:branched-chain amino acid transport system permease protein